MESVVLVDSCVFIGLLREGRDPITELTQRIPLDQLATCGMVRLEVIRGLSQPKARRILEEFMDVLLNVPTDNRLWEQATDLAWKLGRSGVTLPSGDLIIAACAQRLPAAVLTYDKHFFSIPGIKVFRSLEELS
jgi:predicted nucleic acid-binding protein